MEGTSVVTYGNHDRHVLKAALFLPGFHVQGLFDDTTVRSFGSLLIKMNSTS